MKRNLILCLALLLAPAAWATTYTWTGAGEASDGRDWNNAGNWTPNGVPGPGDEAVISQTDNHFIIHMQGTVWALAFSGGMISEGTLTIAGTTSNPGVFQWSGGTISGVVDITVTAGSYWRLLGGGEKSLGPGTIHNAGLASLGAGSLGGSSGAVIDNTGVFAIVGDLPLTYAAHGGPNTATFQNRGTLEKTAGTGAATFDSWNLDTSSNVEVMSGALWLRNSGNLPHTFSEGAQFNGVNGLIRIASASATAPDVAVAWSGHVWIGGNLELGSGADANGGAQLTGHGNFRWTGGSITGDFGSTEVSFDPTVTVTGPDLKSALQEAHLRLNGTTTWDNGDWQLSGATVYNSGTFTASSPGALTFNQAGAVENTGTFVKTGASTTTIQDTFNNAGTMRISEGTLRFDHAQYAGLHQSSGTLSLEGGSLVAYEPTLADGNQRQLVEITGGRLIGTGTLDADVSNAGTIAPGDQAAGTLSILGDYTQTGSGTYVADVLSTADGGFDSLAISGTATLDGTLHLTFADGVDLHGNDRLEVIEYGSHSGEFASVTASNGHDYHVRYDDKAGVLGGAGAGCSSSSGAPWLGGILLVLGLMSARRGRTLHQGPRSGRHESARAL